MGTRRTPRMWILVGLAFTSFAWSCGESVSSSDVATSGIYADLSAKAKGDGATNVDIFLRAGGVTSNTTLELDDGDELGVTADGDQQNVSTVDLPVGDATGYRARVPKEAEGTTFVVSLTRQNYEDAPNSTTTLPKPFEIDAPSGGAEFSRQESFTIELSNRDGGASQSVSIHGDCIETYTQKVDSTSTINVPSGAIESKAAGPNGNAGETCNATIEVTRTNQGTVDGAYGEGGHFPAIQGRDVSFTSKP